MELWEYLDGMMPREFEYFQYTEVWKKTVHSFLDVLVVPTMIEAVTGVEFITGDHLMDNEQAGKAVQSLIQAVSIGMTAGGAYSKGITYVIKLCFYIRMCRLREHFADE